MRTGRVQFPPPPPPPNPPILRALVPTLICFSFKLTTPTHIPIIMGMSMGGLMASALVDCFLHLCKCPLQSPLSSTPHAA